MFEIRGPDLISMSPSSASTIPSSSPRAWHVERMSVIFSWVRLKGTYVPRLADHLDIGLGLSEGKDANNDATRRDPATREENKGRDLSVKARDQMRCPGFHRVPLMSFIAVVL